MKPDPDNLTPPRGPWAIEPNHLETACGYGRTVVSFWDEDDDDEPSEKAPYSVQDGIATVSLTGPMMKRASFWSWYFGGCGTAKAKDTIRQAAADPSVTGILLLVDSPGGTVDGTAELADEVAAADKQKPVHAYIDGQACSAAYWVASQARKITAPRTAQVGCIGTYAVIEDYSGAAEKAGIKVHVIKAGAVKGTGVTGAPVTKAQIDAEQRLVTGLNAHFLEAVGKGRKMSPEAVAAIATGETYTGDQGKALGLVDALGTCDDARAGLEKAMARPANRYAPWGAKETNMDIVGQIRALLNGSADEATDLTDAAGDTAAAVAPVTATTTGTATVEASGNDAGASAEAVWVNKQEYAALTAERDAFKAQLETVTNEARETAKAAAVRAFGVDGAKAHEAAITAADLTGARAIAQSFNALADKAFGIDAGHGGTRQTAPSALPEPKDLNITGQDATAGKPNDLDPQAIYERRKAS